MKTRRNITVSPDVASVLDQQHNTSAYIEALVRAHLDGTSPWRCSCGATQPAQPARACPACGVLLVSEMEVPK